jgi:uncharacterized protein YsxB (DUF464 family)
VITVTKTNDSISVKGHAGYADQGKDIVCAGVSVLAQTLVYSLEELTEDKIDCSMQSGDIFIKFWTLSGQAQLLVESFLLGIQSIADAYPENVTLSKH